MINRPERVLQKGDEQTVTCKCGNSFKIAHDVREAICPKCGQTVNWRLSK
jgi:predicted RNA-binding Zn-ribbon protein involved in translation (DUF1610 family)